MRSDQNGERLEEELEAEAVSAEEARGDGSPGAAIGREGDPGFDMEDGEGAQRPVDSELAASRERYLRLAAEFENYRKRTDRERGEGGKRAQAQLVERLLEPLDDLQRVAHFSGESSTAEALLEGVQMVERKLLRVLEAAGLEVVEAKGERFDPSRHEALMTAEAESADEDETVGEVFQNGYSFKGQLLRPARVQVKKFHG
jgi:molecular chaperone GrpE